MKEACEKTEQKKLLRQDVKLSVWGMQKRLCGFLGRHTRKCNFILVR